jgi:AraC-like DNA-binding protein
MLSRLDIRSYRDAGPVHAHDHVQLVLPFGAGLEIEVDGHGAHLSPDTAAFILPGTRHTQQGHGPNRALILDAPDTAFPAPVLDRLGAGRFFRPPPALGHLVAFAASRAGSGPLDGGEALALARLLVGAVADGSRAASRLDALAEHIRSTPGGDWTPTRLARELGVSRSVLFRRLADEAGTTPARFVARQRLEAARAAIRDTAEPLAEIAVWAGFPDQSALTRALKRSAGITPGALRRRAGTKGPEIGTPGQAGTADPV